MIDSLLSMSAKRLLNRSLQSIHPFWLRQPASRPPCVFGSSSCSTSNLFSTCIPEYHPHITYPFLNNNIPLLNTSQSFLIRNTTCIRSYSRANSIPHRKRAVPSKTSQSVYEETPPQQQQEQLQPAPGVNYHEFNTLPTNADLPNPLTATPVVLPPAHPDDVIREGSPACGLLQHPCLAIGRQLEMLNVLVGFEQANKYAVKDAAGNFLGFIVEEDITFTGSILRQVLNTRRAFKALVLDAQGIPVLKIQRPVKWFLNSSIKILSLEDDVIGEVKQVWHPLRRKYDLFLKSDQFGAINGGFWTWHFATVNENNDLLSIIDRNFGGFAREIFTDTGVYGLQFDSCEPARPLSLDERAVLLACAVTIDIDYFSRHSGGSGLFPAFVLFESI